MIVKLSRSVQKFGALKCTVIQSDTLDEASSGLVILNHGFGASGDDLVDLGAMLMDDSETIAAKFRFIFPEAPIDLGPMGMPGGRAWWPINMAQLAEINQTQDFSKLTSIRPPGMPEAAALLDTAVTPVRCGKAVAVKVPASGPKPANLTADDTRLVLLLLWLLSAAVAPMVLVLVAVVPIPPLPCK